MTPIYDYDTTKYSEVPMTSESFPVSQGCVGKSASIDRANYDHYHFNEDIRSIAGDIRLAAGGIIRRYLAFEGKVYSQILLIFRHKQQDWTFPKGKLEKNETWEQAAIREIQEETNLATTLDDYLGSVFYVGKKEKGRIVRYWNATITSGETQPSGEIDGVLWVSIDQALKILTYEHDKRFLSMLRNYYSTPMVNTSLPVSVLALKENLVDK